MYNVNNSATIASLLNETPRPVLLIGAGASVTSGIPLAAEVVNKTAKWAYARQSGKDPNDPRITKSDWYPWLQAQPWFNPDLYLADLFPYAVENLLQPQKIRKDFWIDILNPDVPISPGYLRLVELMHLKRINNVLTTNFDDCISKARNVINRPHHIDIIKSPNDYTKISSNPQFPCLIYLHGAVENYTDKNVIKEVQEMDQGLVENLIPILKDCPLIVVGYRGSESSIMDHLLLANAEKAFNYKNGIYWCLRKGESVENVSEKVKQLSKTIGSNLQFVEIESFDHLFDKVVGAHLDDKRIDLPEQKIPVYNDSPKEPTNFDLQIAGLYQEGDIDKALLRSRVLNYCDKLNIYIPDGITDSWLIAQMKYLNLLREDISNETSITNAGILLFSRRPDQLIPSAKIKISFIGATDWLQRVLNDSSITSQLYERTIEGNLWSQLNQINEALSLVNKPFRLKSEKSEDVLPYDPLALKEVIVNSIVHRDYTVEELNRIEIYPDRIVVQNPGGLIDEVKPYYEDAIMTEEIRKGRRGIKGYRNPALADLFYSSGDMDKKGSGLYDVVTRVEANSGGVELAPNESNSQFSVCLWRRPETIDGVTNTAVSLTVTSTKFFTNILAFKQLPERVYFSDSQYRFKKDIFETYSSISFPPFLLAEKKIYSFSKLSHRNNPVRNIIDVRAIDSLAIDEFLASEDGERQFVRMVNDYIKAFLWKKGLIVDAKRKRAYFPKNKEGEERTVSYQARFKKATRTVARPKYSANKEKIKYWEHKGFNYSVKKFGNEWGVLIEPTYIFTIDGYKWLFAPLKVGALATKKASRDYNKNVLNDITFWLWVMAGESNAHFALEDEQYDQFGGELLLSAEYLKGNLNLIEYGELENEDILESTDSDVDDEIALLADQETQSQQTTINEDIQNLQTDIDED